MPLTNSLPYGAAVVEKAHDKGLLFILIGPAGVGKNTIINEVKARLPELRQLPTVTTRPPRDGEQEGREHYFVSRDRFEELKANGDLVEYQEVHPGKFYGTPRRQTQEALDADKLMIADIDLLGAQAVKQSFPDQVVLIFIEPPSMSVLAERIRAREKGKMTEEEISDRLRRAEFELGHAGDFENRIVNDELEPAIRATMALITRAINRHHA